MEKVNIALFASGKGTNAINIIDFFSSHKQIQVSLLITNKKDAAVIEEATIRNIECLYFPNEAFEGGLTIEQELDYREISWVILAGFLRKISRNFVKTFENRIINIHPSLLPKYGGKGMYGRFVHEAVKQNKEIESGITIHLVNEEFDKGTILAQFKTPIEATDSVEEIAAKIHLLEQKHFPEVIETTIFTQNSHQ